MAVQRARSALPDRAAHSRAVVAAGTPGHRGGGDETIQHPLGEEGETTLPGSWG